MEQENPAYLEQRDSVKIAQGKKGDTSFEFKMYRDKGESVDDYLKRISLAYVALKNKYGGSSE